MAVEEGQTAFEGGSKGAEQGVSLSKVVSSSEPSKQMPTCLASRISPAPALPQQERRISRRLRKPILDPQLRKQPRYKVIKSCPRHQGVGFKAASRIANLSLCTCA